MLYSEEPKTDEHKTQQSVSFFQGNHDRKPGAIKKRRQSMGEKIKQNMAVSSASQVSAGTDGCSFFRCCVLLFLFFSIVFQLQAKIAKSELGKSDKFYATIVTLMYLCYPVLIKSTFRKKKKPLWYSW